MIFLMIVPTKFASLRFLLVVLICVQFALLLLAATTPAPTAKPEESRLVELPANASQASLSLGCIFPGSNSNRVTYLEWHVGEKTVCRLFLEKKPVDFRDCRSKLQPLGINITDTDLQLLLAPVLTKHEDRYRCLTYENSVSYELITQLLVRDRPSEPSSLRCSERGPDWARLDWEPPRQLHHLPVDRYEVASWPSDTDTEPPADVSWSSSTNATARQRRVSGLSAYSLYCFAVRAINSIGAGPPTVTCGVRTLELPPEPDAFSIKLLRASATKAAFLAAFRPERLHGRLRYVQLSFHYLRFRELSAAYAPTQDGWLRPQRIELRLNASEEVEKELVEDKLQPYCQYNLTYTIVTSHSVPAHGFLLFNTTEGLAPAPILTLVRQLQFDMNATLTWYMARRVPCHVLLHRVRFYGIGLDDVLRELNVSASSQQVLLTNLQPNTEYRVTVAAITGLGAGAESNEAGLFTDPSWPSPPLEVQVETGFAAGAVVSWALSQFTLQPPGSMRSIDAVSSPRTYPQTLLTFSISWRFVGSSGSQAPVGAKTGSGQAAAGFGRVNTGLLSSMGGCKCIAESWLPRSNGTPCRLQHDRLCVLIPWSDLAAVSSPPDNGDVITRLRFEVRSVGLARFSNDRRYPGHASECASDIPTAYLFTTSMSAASLPLERSVIVGIIVGGCIVLLAVAVITFLVWKWLCSHRGYRRPFAAGTETLEFLEHEYNGTRNSGSRPQFRPYSQTEFKALSIPEFREHVLTSHANDNSAFQMQFDDVQRSTHRDWPASHWKLQENLPKNRYTDIYPFDHTRVILFSNSGKRRGDYINANYVDGYHLPKAYIACQGPLPGTFDDFWLMVWENKSSVVVMISNFVERGRRKCDQYWPSSGSQTYGHIAVKFLSQASKAAYCLRVFSIRDTRAKKSVKERLVHHYLYSEWPDYGVPQYPLPVLNFVQKSIQSSDDLGPIVVHCSAGVGRTGTFICIEAQIRQIQQEKTVNVRGFLEHIRQQRMRLVQTEEQYVFIHDVLLEYLLCPEREVSRDQLPAYIKELYEPGPCGCSRLETQYQLCLSSRPSANDFISARKACNARKNRTVLPFEARRVKLTAEPGIEGSDFINASHLHGYFSMNEYIVTQHPLEETVFDFLKMIWDHNCSTVVWVYSEEPPEGPLPRIWPTPEDDMREAEYLQLYFRNEEEFPFATRREFLMATKRDDYSLVVSLWTLKRWPELLGQALEMMRLVGAVSERRVPPVSPLIVMDTYGSSHAGIFCALFTLYHQLLLEDSADVYSLFKLYHLQRPGVFNTPADLQFIYEVIAYHARLSSPSGSLPPQQRREPGGSEGAGGTLGSRGGGAGDRRGEGQQQLPAQETPQQAQREVEAPVDGQSQDKSGEDPEVTVATEDLVTAAAAAVDISVAFSNGDVAGRADANCNSNGSASLAKDA